MNARDPLFWRRAAAIRAKEWAQVWLDPSTFGLVVLMPLILMFLFGSADTLDVRATRTGLIARPDQCLAQSDRGAGKQRAFPDRRAGQRGRGRASAARRELARIHRYSRWV